uniref:Uncharacterized protein LOC100176283 n=1 Tax=Phallusia mammillata TaxID=59560 RepID=A0A6F9DFQ6_9ASCI|nr:uncharacterized protein LOC100176283 [Phallusia mammillata]
MKPPKNMRKAMRSFLGVKKRDTSNWIDRDTPVNYRTNLEKSKKKFGSVDHLNRAGRMSDRFANKRAPSQTSKRSMSLPPGGRNRIESWDDFQGFQDDFATRRNNTCEFEDNMRRTVSTNATKHIGRTQSLMNPQDRSMRNEFQQNRFEENSFEGRQNSFRDSGAFDLYINEDITESDYMRENREDQSFKPRNMTRVGTLPPKSRNKDLYPMKGSQSLPRSASFSTFTNHNSKNARTTSQVSNASERLLSCMDALDHLEEKLASVSKVTTNVERFGETTDRIGSIHLSEDNTTLPVNDWSIGGADIRQPDLTGFSPRDRHRSAESSSTDSGITSNTDWGCSNENNPPSRPRRSKAQQQQHKQQTPKYQSYGNESSNVNSKRHLRSESMSSGYSSGSGGAQAPQLQHNYPAHPGYPDDHDSVMSLYSAGGGEPYPGYEYDQQGYVQEYPQENPYGYGAYAYPPSSVYEEEMHQQNGWFFIPSSLQPMPYSPAASQDFSIQSQMPQQYHSTDNFAQYPCYPNQGNDTWHSRYGALNESFMDPQINASPLAQAIQSTCAETLSCDTDVSKSDVKKYGSFRYRNGQKTVMIPQSAESRRRKTVRFSKTVNQRVEHCDSEVEDSTSVIKGCTGEENYDIPTAWKAQTQPLVSADGPPATACGSVTEPIYEFPTGHIENSCMCSDCQLARKSCQLQAPVAYPYY